MSGVARWSWFWTAVCAASSALAQPAGFRSVENRDQFELSENVQLDRADSGVKKSLDQVQSHLAAQQWAEAIDALIQLMETSGGKLVGVTERRFISVRDYCHLQLASLPPEALMIYRSRVDAEARKTFEEGAAARDLRRLAQVVDQSLASSWADNALYALGEIALESGDYAAARANWEKIVPVQQPGSRTWLSVPDTDLDLAGVRARLVLASILEGSTERAGEELAAFSRLHPEARGRLGGREVKYVEALASLLAESANWPRPAAGPDWPTFAGSPARNTISPHSPDPGGVAWRATLAAAPSAKPIWGDEQHLRRVADDAKTPLSYHPVVVDDLVFANNQVEVLAFRARTGEPPWGHETSAIFRDQFDPSVHALYNPPNTIGVPRFTMTVHGGKLFVRMGSAASGQVAEERGPPTIPGYLVCLDLKAEGRLLWKVSPEEGWSFEGSPIADGTSAYVAMRQNDIQPQRYVACFDAETGQRRWRQFVSATETPARGMLLENANNLLTLQRETIYYNTNAGAVAALSARDGRLLWVSLYPRVVRGRLLKPAPHTDRDLVPCLFDRGTLYVAPADSQRIFALEAATGQILWQTGPETEDVVHLLGVAGDCLIASGHRLYWIGLKEPEQGRVNHAWPDGAEKLGYGRGLLAGDCVWWPTRERIYLFDQYTAQLKKEVSLASRNATGGNILVAGNRVLIATGSELIALGEQAGQPKSGNNQSPTAAASTRAAVLAGHEERRD